MLILFFTMAPTSAPGQTKRTRAIVFLTREGCVNTATMRERLDEALDRLGVPTDYQVVDVDRLPDSDVRRGYGTPTVLFEDRDVFEMPEPTPPLPSPT
ncbi:MAG: hypothetical protein AB7H81_03585 [Vicinamibacterales bacterium]